MLSTNIGEIIVLFLAVMANWAMPLLPIHILWINLVTDSLPALALSVDPAEPDVMNRKPVDSRQNIMNRAFATRVFLQGCMIGLLSLAAFKIGEMDSVEVGRSMTFAVLALCQMTHVFNVRSPRHSAFRNMFKNKLLIGAIGLVILLQLALLLIPALHDLFKLTTLNATQWLWVAGLSLAPLAIMESLKGVSRLFRTKN